VIREKLKNRARVALIAGHTDAKVLQLHPLGIKHLHKGPLPPLASASSPLAVS